MFVFLPPLLFCDWLKFCSRSSACGFDGPREILHPVYTAPYLKKWVWLGVWEDAKGPYTLWDNWTPIGVMAGMEACEAKLGAVAKGVGAGRTLNACWYASSRLMIPWSLDMNSDRVSALLLCIPPHSRESTVSLDCKAISFMSSLTLVFAAASIILWMKVFKISLGSCLMLLKEPASMSWF